MKSLIARLLPAAILVAVVALRSHAQTPGEWHDDLVEHMTGSWKVRGQVMGRDAHHELKAEWVLNHMFLRIQESTSTDAPTSEKRYLVSRVRPGERKICAAPFRCVRSALLGDAGLRHARR